jgi:hypothetical protein
VRACGILTIVDKDIWKGSKGRKGNNEMNITMEIKCFDAEEMNAHQKQLRRYGYKRIENAFFCEIWKRKDTGNTVMITREF